MAEPGKIFSRPRDESLQAYKDWINGILTALTGKQPEESDKETTEEEWIAGWKKFWKKDEGGKA